MTTPCSPERRATRTIGRRTACSRSHERCGCRWCYSPKAEEGGRAKLDGNEGRKGNREEKSKESGYENKPAADDYYKPGEAFKTREVADKDGGQKGDKGLGEASQAKAGGDKQTGGEKREGDDKRGEPKGAVESPPAVGKPPQPDPPPSPKKMIIRTGDVEYEVDSFDAAMKQIRDLVQAAGGDVGNTDRKKQSNGKIQGYVVVRIPPLKLDDFLDKMRDALAKLGAELKGQRITSRSTRSASPKPKWTTLGICER